METREIEFAKLRHAYVTVKSFVDSKGFNKIKSLDSKIKEDVGLIGDDNLELLEEFIQKFELDHKDFDYSKHFHHESELFNSGTPIINLLALSVWLPLKAIELLTLNKINLDKPKLPVTPDREVSDLTFKDLLTWYIEKDFKPSGQIKYKIKLST